MGVVSNLNRSASDERIAHGRTWAGSRIKFVGRNVLRTTGPSGGTATYGEKREKSWLGVALRSWIKVVFLKDVDKRRAGDSQ